jgi:RNA polymerase sigma-70 factor (sigma-E family)
VRAADEAAFRDLYLARRGPLRQTAHLLCGDWHQAEDLVQSSFVKLYVAWARVRRVDGIEAYLRQTLVNLYIDETRRRRHRDLVMADPPTVPQLDPGEPVDRQDLITALRGVPRRQRACLVLRFYEDLSVAQTAALLDCTEGTVKSQTARGLDALRDVLASADSLSTSSFGKDRT